MSARNLLAALLVVASACSGDDDRVARGSRSSRAAEKSDGAARMREASTFVGVRYDPLPAGITYESGTVILGPGGQPSRFALSQVGSAHGSMLWLDELLPDEGVTRRRIVRAAMNLPARTRGERIVIGTCGVGGSFNGDVIALVRNKDGQPAVVFAWRANPAAARFDTIPTSGVTCDEPRG
jgi:hypothetical protein